MPDNAYPECERLLAVRRESQAIGEFLKWAREDQGLSLCAYSKYGKEYAPSWITVEKLLAEFFNINLGKVEEERRQMLRGLREGNSNES